MGKIIKVKAGEDLSPANIQRALSSMEDGGTKKSACEILGISYNTKRLQTIIDNYIEDVEREKRFKAKKRGKPIDGDELVSIIETYFNTGSIQETARSHYRGILLTKQALSEHGALLKAKATDYFKPELLPDECVREDFQPGQLVWSSRYNTFAEVVKQYKNSFRVWLLKDKQYAYQPPEELGDLSHLQKLGVNLERLSTYD